MSFRQCSPGLALVIALILASCTSDRRLADFSPGYQLARSIPVSRIARVLAHADLNRDGKEDLIVAGTSERMRERAVEILEGNGDGTFRQGARIELQNPTKGIAVADLNGDGKPDLILVHPGVGVLLNTTPYPGAPVSFGSEQVISGGSGPLAAADLNGDGRAEVLVGTHQNHEPDQALLRIVAPVFIDANHYRADPPAVEIPIPGVPISIAVADFDGDGKPDVAFAFRQTPSANGKGRGGVVVLLNRTESAAAPIKFATPIRIDFDHSVDFIAAADLNGDAREDLFVSWCGVGTEPCAGVSLLNRRDADKGVQFDAQNMSLGVARASHWLLQDINHDGKPDLLFISQHQGVRVPASTPGEIVVALGIGDGRFATPRTFFAPTSDSLDMVLADFNRDGLPDLVVLDRSLRVLLGQKDGGFSAPESLAGDFTPTLAIPFSDHNRTAGFVVTDSAPLYTPTRTSHTAAVYDARTPDFPYKPVSTMTIPDGAIAVGDLKADGRKETVVVTSHEILVYDFEDKTRGQQPKGVKVKDAYTGFLSPQRAILEDLNGDGKPDLIVGAGYSWALQVFMNTSSSTVSFADPVSIPWCPAGTGPLIVKTLPILSIELVSADMNADGKPDLVVAGYCGLNLITNRTADHGPITFDPPVPVMNKAGESPRRYGLVHFALADVNRDGKTDLIVSENSYDMKAGDVSTLDVLVNETVSSPSFRLAQHLLLGKRVASLAPGDFNHDGWPDIATIDASDGTLTFFLNDGDWTRKGAFAVHSSFFVMPQPQQVLVIDSPGKGSPRLLLRNSDGAAIVQ